MIRTRNTWALALVLCAGLWACDSGGGGGKDNSGGTGGIGGTGGGGSGGTGGSGGNQPSECGNGITEPGEDCDDGNLDNGDGCDSNCVEEIGLCDDAINFRLESTQMAPWRIAEATFPGGTESRIEGSCGGAGPEVVFSYRTDKAGYMIILAADTDGYLLQGASVYVMRDCDIETEVVCAVNNAAQFEMEVEADSEFFVVVDHVDPLSSDLDFLLGIQFYPIVEEGQACDPTGTENICRQGYVCKGTPATCQEGTAPVITRAALYHGTDPGFLIAEGTDEEGDIVAFEYETLDANGNPINAVDTDFDGTFDGSSIALDAQAIEQGTFGIFGVWPNNDGTWNAMLPTYWSLLGLTLVDPSAPVAAIRLTLYDAANLASEPFVVYPPAIVPEGGECDNEGYTQCDEMLLCKGEPLTCQPGTAPVLGRVLYASRDDRGEPPLLLVEGTDPDDDVMTLRLELLDENGESKAYDFNGDGVADYDNLDLDMEGTGEDGTFFAGWYFPVVIPQVAITVVDSLGMESERQVLVLAPMVWRAEGESCEEFGFEMCGVGLKCVGDEELACEPGNAPVINRAVFGARPDGKQALVFEGVDLDDDLAYIRFEMLDAEGNVILLDYDDDGVDDPYMDIPFATDGDTTFLGSYTVGPDLIAPQIALTAIDDTYLFSERLVVPNEAIPVVAVGEACSPDGWNSCEAGIYCQEEGEGYVCVDVRGAVCEAAPVIDAPAAGSYTATGTVSLPSLWDGPTGCSAPYTDPVGMPEGLVILNLGVEASKVTISTVNAVTENGIGYGDTIVYVIPGDCGQGAVMGCNDDLDTAGDIYGSTLELRNVAAGTYTIVVDTWDTGDNGGEFQVDVNVQ
jgi:cysteine-rich repeat protein